jgi:hypothetical protein
MATWSSYNDNNNHNNNNNSHPLQPVVLQQGLRSKVFLQRVIIHIDGRVYHGSSPGVHLVYTPKSPTVLADHVDYPLDLVPHSEMHESRTEHDCSKTWNEFSLQVLTTAPKHFELYSKTTIKKLKSKPTHYQVSQHHIAMLLISRIAGRIEIRNCCSRCHHQVQWKNCWHHIGNGSQIWRLETLHGSACNVCGRCCCCCCHCFVFFDALSNK